MSRELTPDELVASRAIECIVVVKRRRLRRAQQGKQDSAFVGVPWSHLIELVDAIEQAYPGWIDRTYDVVEARDTKS
jgi:hypothetical protein